MDKKEVEEWNQEIEDLLNASQKPFSNRLEAAIFLYIAEEMDQVAAQHAAIDLAAFMQQLVYIDVDRIP